MYTDYDNDLTMPYSAIMGCNVENLNAVPEGMIGRSFDGSNDLKTTAKSDLSQDLIVKEWSKIWDMNLERRYTVDFEVFGKKAQNPSDTEVAFLVAVK